MEKSYYFRTQIKNYPDDTRQINLDAEELYDLCLDYQGLKKRILREFGYSTRSSKNSVELAFKENNLDMKIVVIPIKPLKEQQRRKKDEPVQFNSDGSVQSFDDNKFDPIIPEEGRYLGIDTVRCAFCHYSNKDTEITRKLGSLYGPYGKKQYVHLLCAIWCSQIHLGQDGTSLHNVHGQVQTARKQKCKRCQKYGAGSRCHDPYHKCTYKAHYLCAKEDGCEFHWNRYVFLCPKCQRSQKKKQKLDWYIAKEDDKDEPEHQPVIEDEEFDQPVKKDKQSFKQSEKPVKLEKFQLDQDFKERVQKHTDVKIEDFM